VFESLNSLEGGGPPDAETVPGVEPTDELVAPVVGACLVTTGPWAAADVGPDLTRLA